MFDDPVQGAQDLIDSLEDVLNDDPDSDDPDSDGGGSDDKKGIEGAIDNFKEKFDNFKENFSDNVEENIDKATEWLDENLDINENGGFDWNDTGQLVNEGLDRLTGKDRIDFLNRVTAPLWDSIPGKPKDWVEDRMQDVNIKILDAINFVQEKFTGEDLETAIDWMDAYSDHSRENNKNNDGQKQPGEKDMTDLTSQEDQNYLSEQVLNNEDIKNTTDKINEQKGQNNPLTRAQE